MSGGVWDVIAEGDPAPFRPQPPNQPVWGTDREPPLPAVAPLAHKPEHDDGIARDDLGFPDSPYLRKLESRVGHYVRIVRRLEYLHGKGCAQAVDSVRRALVGMNYYWEEVRRVDALLAAREAAEQPAESVQMVDRADGGNP